MQNISISVRNIIELVLRSGDIDSGLRSSRAQDGLRAHQRIQRKRKREALLVGLCYESEVSLGTDFPYREFIFRIDGRADGILIGGGRVVIEEIKSTVKPLELLTENPVHLAQAKLYGYIYCEDNALEEICLRLTYCNIETEEVLEFDSLYTRTELREFFTEIIEGYYVFAQMDDARLKARLTTAAALEFPYPSYRAGQRELAAAVYRTVVNERALFAQAPTGTGKTISALYPAIKALGTGKIFYLTAKTVTRGVANEALALMQYHGLDMRSVTLTAKDKLCLAEGECSPEACVYARGHFDRVNAAVIDIITNERIIRREQLEDYAQKHTVCPFEFSLDVTGFCDCIICDYNHVYDPKAQLRRFFGDGAPKQELIILNDEAHNLIERAREMFSAELTRADFGLRGMFRGNDKRLYRLIGGIRSWFKAFEGLNLTYELPLGLISMLRELIVNADPWLAENRGRPRHAEFLELYFKTLDFLRISEFFDERYVAALDDRGEPSVKLLCLDPSFLLAKTHNRARASVFFSATLTPLKYFRDVFGGTGDDYGILLPSPFPRANLCVIISEISTVYKNRGNSIRPVSESLYSLFTSRPSGNYFAFFSSYEYMNSVYEYFTNTYFEIETVLQTPGMTDGEKESFLKRFKPSPGGVFAGFVVMGGIFSEGIDLVGERLCGAAVVGVGLPMITAERNILSDYYKERLGTGFEYAYMYPGMNKVMQAAGRVIRSEKDRGAVLLIDSRFTDSCYRRLLPDEWSHYVKANVPGRLTDILKEFWNAHDIADGGL